MISMASLAQSEKFLKTKHTHGIGLDLSKGFSIQSYERQKQRDKDPCGFLNSIIMSGEIGSTSISTRQNLFMNSNMTLPVIKLDKIKVPGTMEPFDQGFKLKDLKPIDLSQGLSLYSQVKRECEIWEANTLESDKVASESPCCSEDVNLCNISTVPDSCRLTDDSLYKHSENKNLFSLLSNISLMTSASEVQVTKGTKDFCENCYRDAYKMAAVGRGVSRKDAENGFKVEEGNLMGELARQATNSIYRKSMRMQLQQKKLFSLHEKAISKYLETLSISDKSIDEDAIKNQIKV